MNHVKPVPEGCPAVMPRLICRDPVAEIEFCKTALGAVELVRRPDADGRVTHAMITISSAMVMIESAWPAIPNRPPPLDGSSPVVLFVYVADVDRAVERALAAGAQLLQPLTNQFWGDRTAWIMDPSGHVWTVASRIEETTEAQRQERLARLHTNKSSNDAKPSASSASS
jgi:PhnB protein